jgi:hypothetical protein
MKINDVKPLVYQMPKEHNYRIEEGKYHAHIHKIVRTPRQTGNGCMDNLRFLFELNVPGKEKFLNLAKAEFPLNLEHGSDLRNMLSHLLGKEALAALSGQEIDFEKMVGMEADVEVEHIITSKRDNYDYPFVQVRDIQPPGTLVKPEIKKEAELLEPAQEGGANVQK